MDDVRLGTRVRMVRHRLGWRQADVAGRAGVSQDTISRVERGQLDALQLRTLRHVLRALEMDVSLVVRWRGGELDRLADEGHAALVARISSLLVDAGWVVLPEVSFSVYGERGSIDVLAWHAATEVLLVVEVKTSLTSVEETLRRHDAKVRLAPRIAEERQGWDSRATARLLVLPEHSTARRRVQLVDAVLRHAYRCADATHSPGCEHRRGRPGCSSSCRLRPRSVVCDGSPLGGASGRGRTGDRPPWTPPERMWRGIGRLGPAGHA